MIDDLSPLLDSEKRKDLVHRLNNKDPEQSLGAEAELSIAWTLRKYDLEIEPVWWKPPKCPDLYVEGVAGDIPLVIEVTAFADTAISGEDVMDHCAQALIALVNAEKKRFGEHLYFHFAETRDYQRGRYERGIAAPKDYKPSEVTRRKIISWINSQPIEKHRLRIEDAGLVVEIEIKQDKQIRYLNYHVSRPPRTYSDTRNPLYRRLVEKSKQLRDTPSGVLRTIFLIEAGSRFLSEVNRVNRLGGVERYSTARQIIQKFLQDQSEKVDSVVVLVPTMHSHFRGFGHTSKRKSTWQVSIFANDNAVNNLLSSVSEMITSALPEPRLDGFNARSLTRQKALNLDAGGWYLSGMWSMEDGNCTYRMSVRAFQDFLAQRIDEKQFRRFVGAEKDGLIGRSLAQGYTIQNIRFESGGTDEDDDYVIFELAKDAAASPFR